MRHASSNLSSPMVKVELHAIVSGGISTIALSHDIAIEELKSAVLSDPVMLEARSGIVGTTIATRSRRVRPFGEHHLQDADLRSF
jgi:hypothetical protein